MSAYQQAGDFLVVQTDSGVQKNGGNVASYFCTPDGHVIHAVGTAVNSQALLTEAQWAKKVFEQIEILQDRGFKAQQHHVMLAHLEALGSNLDGFREQLQQESKSWRPNYFVHAKVNEPVDVLKRRAAVKRLSAQNGMIGKGTNSRAHQIFAAQPLERIEKVDYYVFEQLTGEKYQSDRSRVIHAGEVFQRARKRKTPVLLVLTPESRRRSAWSFHSGQVRFQNDSSNIFNAYSVQRQLKKMETAVLPVDQLAALSNLADTPNYRLATTRSIQYLLVDPDGKQLEVIVPSDIQTVVESLTKGLKHVRNTWQDIHE